MRRYWWEVWTRPGDANFGKLIADLPVINSGPHSGLNQVGNGSLTLPGDFDTSLLVSDSVKRLCRLMCIDGGLPEMAFEFFPGQAIPSTSATDPDVSVTGIGMNGVLAYARTEPWDWDGSDVFASQNPDWIWGGPNALPPLGLSDLQNINAEWDVHTTGSPASVQIEVTTAAGTQTTAAFGFNASAQTVENRLQALSNLTDVTVQGAGTSADPWRIIFYNPAVATVTDVIVSSGTGVFTEIVVGGWSPAPVTRSQFADQRIDPMIHGDYGDPPIEVVFSPLDTGADYAVQVNATGQFAGSQILVRVRPGALYQASIRVRPNVTGLYRLVIRDQYDQLIKWHTPNEITLTAGSYQTLTVPDVLIPAGVTTIIMRVAVVSSNPSEIDTFWVNWEDAEFTEGMPKATPGKILQDLYDDATINHAGRVVWDDDANPGTPYLTLDFTDAVDSNGDAWNRTDLSFRTPMRMSYSQVMAEICKLGYEYRIIPDDVENGSWLWQVFNPGGLGTDRSADPYPGIIGGTTDIRRQLAAISPSGTDVMVETIDYRTARVRDATMISNLGRVEASVLRRDAIDSVVAANEALDSVKRGARSDQYTFADPGFRPMVDFDTGDVLGLDDPPERPDEQARVIDIAGALGDGEEWTVQFGSAIDLNPTAAVADAVGRLMLADPVHRPQGAFDRRGDQILPTATTVGGGGSGAPTVVVAASDATPMSLGKADFICSGTDDQVVINQAIASLTVGGRVLLTEGTYNVSDGIFGFGAGGPVSLQGMVGGGSGGTYITGSTTGSIVSGFAMVADMSIEQNGSGEGITIDPDTVGTRLRLSSGGGPSAEVRGILSDSFVLGSSHPAILLQITTSSGPDRIPGLRNLTCLEGGILVAADLAADTRPQGFIADCRIYQAGYGLQVSQLTGVRHLQLVVTGFVADLCTQGIRILDTGGVQINGFSINRSPQHGVFLNDSWATNLQGIIYNSSLQTTNTYDAVHVTGDSYRNRIMVTTIESGFTNLPRYNVFFDAGTADNIESSDLRSNTGTGAYLDTGTGNTVTDEHLV